MPTSMKHLAAAIALSLGVTAIAILSRPILPIDETRYISVAWEAYVTGDLLVSHKNGTTYAHKPPLLFWLINASWWLFGVSEIAARIVAPFAGVLCLPLIQWIAKRLWPDDTKAANFAPYVLASFSVWLLFAPLTMFDTLLTLSALIAICGVLHVVLGRAKLGWLMAGVGMGLGILTKGPVIFVHVLPIAVLGIWWARDLKLFSTNDAPQLNSVSRISASRWYLGVLISIVLAAAIGLAWAIPSAIAGGKEYGDELLWGQTAGRVAKSFSHRHPFYWYVPILPLCLLPWLLLGTVWRGARSLNIDWTTRFLASWILGPLLILSLISGKQVHYLMPLFPAFALLFSKMLSQIRQPIPSRDIVTLAVGTGLIGCLPLAFNNIPKLAELGLAGIVPSYFVPVLVLEAAAIFWFCRRTLERVVLGLAGFSAVSVSIIIGAGAVNFWRGFSVDGLAQYVAQSKSPTVWYGEYHAQLNFAGRLKPFDWATTAEDLHRWIEHNDSGVVIMRLVGEGEQWKRFLATEGTQTSSQPTAEQLDMLRNVLADKREFMELPQVPEPVALYWIRHGLHKKPHVALCVNSEANSKSVAAPREIRR